MEVMNLEFYTFAGERKVHEKHNYINEKEAKAVSLRASCTSRERSKR
jgi:hypothetical protein